MSKASGPEFARRQAKLLAARLEEPRRFVLVVAGPRQAGKTTLVRQALAPWGEAARYASADEPTLRDRAWVVQQWEAARILARGGGRDGAILALDEIQKVPAWSATVKSLWDADTRVRLKLKVVLLSSAPLHIQRGLTESLAVRFELLPVPHWSLTEMRAAFGFTLEQYLFFGGYPGAAPWIGDPPRWARYIKDSLIETTVARDVLLLSRVDKPALLRQLFELGCRYSGQILSYTKMLGQLHDAGNTTTLAHYLELLAGAGILTGLQKFSGPAARQRGSIPKLQVLNTALMTAQSGFTLAEAKNDTDFWGRLTESAVGAHLANLAAAGECELRYWREKNREVDFVVQSGRRVVAIEVKSGRRRESMAGMAAFQELVPKARALLVGGDGIPLEEFLERAPEEWLAG